MRLGVIGGGVVGRATARAFIEHVEEVRVYDVVKERATHNVSDVLACDLVFVCLPTPQKSNSLECDTSALDRFFQLDRVPAYHWRQRINFVLRSTVPIGTTRRLREQYGLTNLVHSPEFLTARCAVTDAQLPARNVIGIDELPEFVPIHEYARTCNFGCWTLLYGLYQNRFPGVPIHVMTSDESEAVKLFQNSFFAVKVSFFNEVHCLAGKLGLDWDRVLEAMLADGRIGASHTKVPGPDGRYGFGGTCLPKDLASLVHQLGEYGMVCNAAYRRNEAVDRKREVRP